MDRRTLLVGVGGTIAGLALAGGTSSFAHAVPAPLSPEALAKLAADGLVETTPRVVDELPARMVTDGGSAWSWRKPETDVTLDLVRLEVTPQLRASWMRTLAATRFEPDIQTQSRFTAREARPSGLRSVALFRGRVLTWVSVPEFAKWVV